MDRHQVHDGRSLPGDVVARYQAALQKLKRATVDATRLVRIVLDCGSRLKDWRKIERPFEFAMPGGEEVGKAIHEWHQALNEAASIWKSMPEDCQIGLLDPMRFQEDL